MQDGFTGISWRLLPRLFDVPGGDSCAMLCAVAANPSSDGLLALIILCLFNQRNQ
jgi:hypothetical protein